MTESAHDYSTHRQPEGEHPAIHLPRPTMWPAVMAAGITMFMAGIVLSFYFSLAAIVIFAIALAGWIRELRGG